MTIAAPRLPVEPLFAALGAKGAIAEDRAGKQGVPSPVSHVARHVGVRPRTVHRWVADGGLPVDVADRVAVSAGFHPGEVWGAEWWALPDPDPVAAAFRALRTRREYARRAARAAKRRRAELVRQYTRVERARTWRADH